MAFRARPTIVSHIQGTTGRISLRRLRQLVSNRMFHANINASTAFEVPLRFYANGVASHCLG